MLTPGTWARELGTRASQLSLLTVVGVGGCGAWRQEHQGQETGVQKPVVCFPASSCPSLGLSVPVCQMGKWSLPYPPRGFWVGPSSVLWVQEGNLKKEEEPKGQK